MEMLHPHFPVFSEKQPAYNIVSYSTTSSPSASSFSDSQDDLLPDLWLETHQPSLGPPQYQLPPMLREVSLEYAQLLLPNSLLAPLTEENLAAQRALCDMPLCGGRAPAPAAFAPSLTRDFAAEFAAAPGAAPGAPDTLPGAPDTRPGAPDTRPGAPDTLANARPHVLRRGSHSSAGLAKAKNINTQLYKTELCVSFMKVGVCPYGGKCQFAHGEEDLKLVSRPANWRSKPCANWTKHGLCRYGKRCCFKHGL